ncbi:MAG: hypothetical protein FWB91_13025 [Defluviitaleaceae bacterium]|nr:hypothetical protein [Defluviitaleaceae bacterium]
MLNSLQINGVDIKIAEGMYMMSPPVINEENPWIITGNVSNSGDDIAVWVLIGQNTGINIPQWAAVDEYGNFTISLTSGGIPNYRFPISTLTVWVVDGWHAMPLNDHFIGNIIDPYGYVTTEPNRYWGVPRMSRFHPGCPNYGVYSGTSFASYGRMPEGRIWGFPLSELIVADTSLISHSGLNIGTTFQIILLFPNE